MEEKEIREPKFTTDDKVQLKSGTGPIMTCRPNYEPTPDLNYPKGKFLGRYWCQYWDENQKKFAQERLSEDYLKKID